MSYSYAAKRTEENLALGLIVFFFTLFCTFLAGWITHVIVCIKTASWLLLIAGCVVFPVGIIHGIGTWFGMF